MNIVTGGAGFIGSRFVRDYQCVVLDKLTYAGRHQVRNLVRGDICDRALVRGLIEQHKPEWIVHFAAESHVDRSIADSEDFARTNVLGTVTLLEEAAKAGVKFLHVSTDEVYGSLGQYEIPFNEDSPYLPNNPYAASKAASDLMVRSFVKTHDLHAIATHCGNNYGPGQHQEKFIPTVIRAATVGGLIPVYGDGMNVRDWIHVDDHCDAIKLVMERGKAGESYNIGASCEMTNLEAVEVICEAIGCAPRIKFVKDRPGHDRRYAINASKVRSLGWAPKLTFEEGIRDMVKTA